MADLTAAKRRNLKPSQFALPGKGEGPKGKGSGSYPIPDAAHARNALARVSQFGSAEERAQVRAKVARSFPGIGQTKGKSKKNGSNGNGNGNGKSSNNTNNRLSRELGNRLAARDR